MKRALLLGLLVALAVPATASARVTNAAGLARDCNTDGHVVIRDFLKVTGGTGTIKRNCFVRMARNATFGLRNVTLKGGDVVFAINDARQGTEVRVGKSTIRLGDGGAIQLAPGCCEGEGEPGRSERRAYVAVSNSTLRAGTVEVSASTADRGGTALVRNSILKGVATWLDYPVSVVASISSRNGDVRVLDSTITSERSARIETGIGGDTLASGNTFSVATPVRIHGEHSCTSTGNTPPTSCS